MEQEVEGYSVERGISRVDGSTGKRRRMEKAGKFRFDKSARGQGGDIWGGFYPVVRGEGEAFRDVRAAR